MTQVLFDAAQLERFLDRLEGPAPVRLLGRRLAGAQPRLGVSAAQRGAGDQRPGRCARPARAGRAGCRSGGPRSPVTCSPPCARWPRGPTSCRPSRSPRPCSSCSPECGMTPPLPSPLPLPRPDPGRVLRRPPRCPPPLLPTPPLLLPPSLADEYDRIFVARAASISQQAGVLSGLPTSSRELRCGAGRVREHRDPAIGPARTGIAVTAPTSAPTPPRLLPPPPPPPPPQAAVARCAPPSASPVGRGSPAEHGPHAVARHTRARCRCRAGDVDAAVSSRTRRRPARDVAMNAACAACDASCAPAGSFRWPPSATTTRCCVSHPPPPLPETCHADMPRRPRAPSCSRFGTGCRTTATPCVTS